MRRFLFGSRRRKAVSILATLGALALAGISAAYFLGQSSTTATFANGSSPQALTMSAVVAPADLPLFPGKSASVDVTVTNNAGHGDLSFDHVSGSVDLASLPSGCGDSTWYTFTPALSQATGSGPHVLHEGDSSVGTGTLSFNESGTDQSCAASISPTLDLVAGP